MDLQVVTCRRIKGKGKKIVQLSFKRLTENLSEVLYNYIDTVKF